MNWLDNVSSDIDQPIAPACLFQGHWQHRLHPHGEPVLCRVVMDVAAPRLVAAQVMAHGLVEDLDSGELQDLNDVLLAHEVHLQPGAWGFGECRMLPAWARPSFSDSQIEELERIQGYLVDASEDNVDNVLALRDQFLQGIGMTHLDVNRAVRQPPQYGQAIRKGSRSLVS